MKFVFLSLLGVIAMAQAQTFSPEQIEFFEKRVRPVLVEQCYSCHSAGAKKIKAGLRVDSRAALLQGGDSGAAIVPGKPDESLLIKSVRYAHQELQMPPKGKLPQAQIDDLVEWIKQGAPWPAETTKSVAGEVFDVKKRKAEWWCWQAPQAAPLPKVKNAKWGAAPIDRFLLARLEKAGLTPAVPADDRVLLRRLNFDLIGLPPTPAEAETFAREAAIDKRAALERAVDRLLASPQFGERWGRHWLDLVRYAETRGHEFDYQIPNAWQYRDYVVRALNADVPYDQFVREHLAGDLLGQPRRAAGGANESILGTGFWFLGEEVHSPVDIRLDETDRMDNRLDVMTKTFQGLTVACARCHDHKFDAISQKDYYALSGFLISSGYRQARFATLDNHRAVAADLEQWQNAARPALLRATGTALEKSLADAPRYLLAARDVVAGAEAAKFDLDAARLARWVEALKAALKNEAHPLHAFAATALEGDFSQRRAALGDKWSKQANEAKNSIAPEQIVNDFSQGGALLQDGFSFSISKSGAAAIGSDAEKPLIGVAMRGEAQRGQAWKVLAAQGEKDVGALGSWERSEQTLITRDFKLNANSVWYLVRGGGRAYAPVSSHLIVQGPLHGALLREWKDENSGWRWIEHRLADYKGQRLRVEISPIEKGDLSVAMVVQSDTRPPLPFAPPEALRAALGNEKTQSPQALADALVVAWQNAAAQMKAGNIAPENAALADALLREQDIFIAPDARKELSEAARPLFAEYSKIAARIQASSPTAPAMIDGSGADEYLLIRGQPKNPGAVVPRRFLSALADEKTPIYNGSGRAQLAEYITAKNNPLTSRVMVNRVWHHLFGRGLVQSVDNFGALGQPPSHPELLDYLALRFQNELGWSVKKLIREIVLTNAYQMASDRADDKTENADPENILLHRANVRRLQGEAIRDAILAVSGRLNGKIGGPPVGVHLTPFMDGRGRPASGPLDGDGRRSLYIAVRRNFLQPMLLAFDAPIPFNSVGKRNVSNVPAQALILMNDPFVVAQAKLWAKNSMAQTDAATRVQQMYLTAFGRPPSATESRAALEFIAAQTRLHDGNAETAWGDFAHVLFNVKEFIYLR
jgi:hypothetical protein